VRTHTRELLRSPLVIATIASIALAIVFTAIWTLTPLRDVVTADNAVDWIESVSERWWTPVLIVLVFIPAGIIMFPRPLITIAAVVAYGAWKGFALSMLGVELASFAGYYAGMAFDRERMNQWAGPTLARMTPLLERNGLATMTMLRLLPIGPFVLGSVAAGVLRIRAWEVFVGTFVGMFPGVLGSTLIGDQVRAGITSGRRMNHWVLWGTVLVLALLLVASRAWFKRLSARASSA
jgi:uncharacterized membrane protein YdjX (TVP38/TMEM64 family)